MSDPCIFCLILAGTAHARVARRWLDAWAIEPIAPVTPGHLLVIPTRHVADVGENPDVSATTMRRAAELAADLVAANIIVSKGAAASATIEHLHLHVVPRVAGDGLALPWTTDQGGPSLPSAV